MSEPPQPSWHGNQPNDPTAPTAPPTPGPTGVADGSSTDARFAKRGKCLVNKGTEQKPLMEIAGCAPGTYQVLERFDGTKDYQEKCEGKVPGYEFYYFFDSDLDTLDFVLCLKKR